VPNLALRTTIQLKKTLGMAGRVAKMLSFAFWSAVTAA
jgi:hypothetical protein